jgi:hypothetical protein
MAAAAPMADAACPPPESARKSPVESYIKKYGRESVTRNFRSCSRPSIRTVLPERVNHEGMSIVQPKINHIAYSRKQMSGVMEPPVLFNVTNGVATITMNRPKNGDGRLSHALRFPCLPARV